MATFYIATTGNAANSGSTDTDAPTHSGTAASQSGADITLDGSPDLSGLVTSGPTQSTIFLNDATNANCKIFRITAVNDGTDTVTVSPTPTGTIAGACAWRIGGRHLLTVASIEGAVLAGDVIQINDSPAASAAAVWTCRASGSKAGGMITMRGKTGVRPVLNHTSTATCIASNSQTYWKIENLELDQDGATGSAVQSAANWIFDNVKVSDAGSTAGISVQASNCLVINCEMTGGAGAGMTIGTTSGVYIIGCYFHDNTTDGLVVTGNTFFGSIINCISESNGGRGFNFTAASAGAANILLMNNTVYGNGNSGFEVVDDDLSFLMFGNIFSENGNAAGEFNVEFLATTEAISVHKNNLFFHSGGGGGANLSNLTAHSTDVTTDPQLTSPAAGDFTIPSGSPAKGTGTPGLVGIVGGTSHADMGALQREEPAGGAATKHVIG